jgi:hypothetical protein
VFYRLNTDGTRQDINVDGLLAGPTRTACWIIGGGPSLSNLPCDAIARSPVAKLGINLGGTRLIRPNLWTSYDPSARFHRSVYLDASIWKFVHVRRAMDLVPETTFKVCECPGVLFFDRDAQRGFADFLPPRPVGIVDWNDTFVQAIEIAYRLGFRVLYLAGCDFQVRPSHAQRERASAGGVEYVRGELLDGFFERGTAAGIPRAELERLDPPTQYHFDEHKPLAAAIQTDLHYFRTAQYLRLSRRALSLAGLDLVSATPDSRLNDYFPYRPVEDVLQDIGASVGKPDEERTRGLYTQVGTRALEGLGPMRDLKPHHWKRKDCPPPRESSRTIRSESTQHDRSVAVRRVRDLVEAMPEIAVHIEEIG